MINKKISFDLRLFIFPRKKEDWNFTKHRLINRRSNFNHQTGIRNTLRVLLDRCVYLKVSGNGCLISSSDSLFVGTRKRQLTKNIVLFNYESLQVSFQVRHFITSFKVQTQYYNPSSNEYIIYVIKVSVCFINHTNIHFGDLFQANQREIR